MVLLSDSNSLADEGRPQLTSNQPVWLGALALSLLLHGGLLLTEYRPWQQPPSSASQTQQVSLTLSGENRPEETQTAPTDPTTESTPAAAEPAVEEAPVEPEPTAPAPGIEEPVVLTSEASVTELPVPDTEAAPIPERTVEPELSPVAAPALTEEHSEPLQTPAPVTLPPMEEPSEVSTTPAPADSPSLAAITPTEPGFSEADRADLMDDYLQEIMKRLQNAFEYPRAAQRRRQQGEVVLELMIAGSGEITSVELNSGSGHALLDDAALAMVRRLTPLPPLPEHFPDGRLQLGVPVVFRLQ
ncbi:MAG: TonB family protein [Saccharospirillum sp.]|nr:TonB family protein [Saccharospirillum sp.]